MEENTEHNSMAQAGTTAVDVVQPWIAPALNHPLIVALGTAIAIKWIIQPAVEKAQSAFDYTLADERRMRDLLMSIRSLTDARRVALILPSNSTVWNTSLHKWKLSIKSEVTATGIGSSRRNFPEMDVSELLEEIDQLEEHNQMEGMPSEWGNSLKDYLITSGTKHHKWILLKRSDTFAVLAISDWDTNADWGRIQECVDQLGVEINRRKRNLLVKAFDVVSHYMEKG